LEIREDNEKVTVYGNKDLSEEARFAPIVSLIAENGYDTVEITNSKAYGKNAFTVVIHKTGGIGLDDCEKVSNLLSDIVDGIDICNGQPYDFNVSSPGLDRPIKSEKDFARNIGERIEVHFIGLIDKKKKLAGVLTSADEKRFVITLDTGKTLTIDKASVKLMHKEIKFSK
jgi:ribosome maturation factor RimP